MTRLLVLGCCAFQLAGCGSGSPPAACIPGATQACLCLGGKQGVQTCVAGGVGWGECESCTLRPRDGGVDDPDLYPEWPDGAVPDLRPGPVPDLRPAPDAYVAVCGNGKVDDNETCDLAIGKGLTGACPTSCDDGNVCTTDLLSGGGTCTASCGHQPVTQCKGGDGCCPLGCAHLTDSDCDPCAGDPCNGHGTCLGGVCTCAAGYAGPSCSSCAPGYTGYPSCVKCSACVVGGATCASDSSITRCPDGCGWTAPKSCADDCLARGFVQKSSGCAYNQQISSSDCYCPTALNKDILIYRFRDGCNDGVPITMGFYDQTLGYASLWPTSTLAVYDLTYWIPIECVTGHVICWGGWKPADTGGWGCGQGCKYPEPGDCIVCGASLYGAWWSLICP